MRSVGKNQKATQLLDEKNQIMRKTIISANIGDPHPGSDEEWIDIENVARFEVTSEDPNFPLESALGEGEGPGWKAAEKGRQIIRIIFDNPRTLRRIVLEFSENKIERTQEFTLRWAVEAHGLFREIVRQQWTFSPHGSTNEIEDYQIYLENVSILELTIKPDLAPENAVATLTRWRVA